MGLWWGVSDLVETRDVRRRQRGRSWDCERWRGETVRDPAAVFGTSLKAVGAWWAKWRAGGRKTPVVGPGASRWGRTGCSVRPGGQRCGSRRSITGPVTGD